MKLFMVVSLLMSFHMTAFAGEGVAGANLIHSVETFAKAYLPKSSLSCAISTIGEMTGLQHYQAGELAKENVGLAVFIQKEFKSNQCLADVAYTFWNDMEKQFPLDFNLPTPSISEEAGKGLYYRTKPGWLWERALKAAHNDPSVAVFIIGVCTNDDTRNRVEVEVGSKVFRDAILENLKKIDLKIANYKSKLVGVPPSSKRHYDLMWEINYQKDNRKKEEARLASNIRRDYLKCPYKGNPVFAPKSLASEVDLPMEFKEEIAKVQAPNKGAQVIPSKTYHFYYSTFLGCKLAECGLSPEMASTLTAFIGRTYRVMNLIDSYEIKKAKAHIQAEELRLDMLAESPAFTKQTQMSENYLAIADAIELNKSIGIFNEAISDQVDPMKQPGSLPGGRIPRGTLCQIPGWSVARCDRARAKLRTWQVDIRWTEMQHRIGGKFGAVKCEGQKPFSSKDLCKIQQTILKAPDSNTLQ